MKDSKPYEISKQVVMTAYQKVKANRGSSGVDGQEIEEFEQTLKGNLYKIWNRMSSGSYFPPPVKAVKIPKKSGGTRMLGIPTVSDRERWLKTPFITKTKEVIERKSGTPQGGVVSPILANLFMHYAFDRWITKNYPDTPFERYADDAIIHYKSEQKALEILEALKARLKECKLELHPQKTKIIYCQDKDRTGNYPHTEFDFLGYTFKKMFIKDRLGRLQFNFLASVSRKSSKSFRDKLKALKIHHMTGCKIEMLAELLGPMIRGWLNYFGRFNFSAVKYTMDWVNRRLIKWAMCKYKRFKQRQHRTGEWLRKLAKREPNMFPHWTLGILP